MISGGQDMSWGDDLDLASGDTWDPMVATPHLLPGRVVPGVGRGSTGGTLTGVEMSKGHSWRLLTGTQQGQHQDPVAAVACVALPMTRMGWSRSTGPW